MALAHATDQVAIFLIEHFSDYERRYLPRSLNSSVGLLERQDKIILSLFFDFKSKSFCNIPLCSIVGILGVYVLDMIQPYCISKYLLMLLRNNLEFTCKLELLGVNLKYALE